MIITRNNEDFETVFFVDHRLGYKIGGGVLIGELISFSLNFFETGIHEIEGISKNKELYAEIKGDKRVELYTITLGVKIK